MHSGRTAPYDKSDMYERGNVYLPLTLQVEGGHNPSGTLAFIPEMRDYITTRFAPRYYSGGLNFWSVLV